MCNDTLACNDDVTTDNLNRLLTQCFNRTEQNPAPSNETFSSTICFTADGGCLNNNKIWETAINNVGNILPIDWLRTHAYQLQLSSLNISDTKDNVGQTTYDLDLSEDEDLQQALDMHSLIVSSVHPEVPMFTAEDVIREIEDMLEEPPSPNVCSSEHSEFFSSELSKIRERSRARISVTRENVESMSATVISELYDELDALVRELSEDLVQELARRDELEYEKELKNQFIGLLLSIQRRQRELIDSKRRNASSKSTEGATAYGGNQPGCYLTTLIPYSDSMVPPTVEHLQIYVKS
jgi:hypothetical protein